MSQESLPGSQAELWAPGVPCIARPPAARVSELLSQPSAQTVPARVTCHWALEASTGMGKLPREGLGVKVEKMCTEETFFQSWLQFLPSSFKPG